MIIFLPGSCMLCKKNNNVKVNLQSETSFVHSQTKKINNGPILRKKKLSIFFLKVIDFINLNKINKLKKSVIHI